MAPPPAQSISGTPHVPTYHYDTPAPATGPTFVVSREEVLAKRAALLAEAHDFQDFLRNIKDQLRMEPMGGDPVSQDVARAVNYRIGGENNDSYFKVCQAWINNLLETATALGEVARQYGYTDEEIAASLANGAPDA